MGSESFSQLNHSAVTADLGYTSGNGKHASWWTRIYGAGVRNITIVHRVGQDNGNADDQPHLSAPTVKMPTKSCCPSDTIHS